MEFSGLTVSLRPINKTTSVTFRERDKKKKKKKKRLPGKGQVGRLDSFKYNIREVWAFCSSALYLCSIW